MALQCRKGITATHPIRPLRADTPKELAYMATLRDEDDNADNAQTTDEAHVEVEQEQPVKIEPEVEVIEEDERLTAEDSDGNDEEPERPHRQKETAAQRRARAKAAKERDKRELDQQRRVILAQEARLEQLERGQNVSRVTELDNRIATALNEVQTMDRVKAAAINAKNGEDVVKADQLREDALQRARQAQWERQQVVERANAPQPREPSYAPMAKEFMAQNPWYNHDGADEDSLIVKAIDAAVAREHNPDSPTYWAELQRRINKRLPDRAQAGDSHEDDDMVDDEPAPKAKPKSGPPVGGSSRGNSATAQSIRLSPERVQALKDAGKWDDPKERQRMAKIYAKYDKDQSTRG